MRNLQKEGVSRQGGIRYVDGIVLSTLAGVYLPGENSLIHSVETKFVKPVFVGDTLLVSGEVVEKNEHFPVIKLKVVITNQKKEKVLRGSMQIGVLKDGE